MKTILVPTDYSESAHNATQYAAALAQRTGASTLVLYHSFFLPVPVSETPVGLPSVEELTDEHLIQLEAIGRDIAQACHLKVECYASPLPVIDQLPELVKRLHADLVVMGMGNISEFDRRVFGSTTTRVIREATFPVLVVPREVRFQVPKHILFACDYEAIAPKNKLTLLQALATTFGAQVEVLHVEGAEPATTGSSRSHKLPNLESILYGVKHQYTFLEEDDVMRGIEKGIQEQQADLLVMVPRPHGFWDTVFNRSTTRKMAFQTHIPLLVLPNSKK